MAKKLKDFKPKMCSNCGKTPCACMSQVDELDRSGTLTRYINKTRGDPERKAGNDLALKKKWGDKNCGLEEPKVKAVDRNEEVELVDEKASDKEVKMATGIPHDKRYVGGNMTGAVSAIEKIRKNLSKHPRVAASLKAANEEINRFEMFEAVDPVEARDILKKHGGADEDFHALPSEHKNSLHDLAYKFKHNPGQAASGSRARMFHAHLKRQAAKADKARADVQKLTKEEHDYEYEMARNQLTTASRSIDRLMGMLKGEGNLEAWVQAKLTLASDYLDTVADYMESDKKTK